MTHSKVMELINTEKEVTKTKKGKGGGDGWNQQIGSNQQILSFGGQTQSNIFSIKI